MDNEKIDITRLIALYIVGELSDDERKLLFEWVNISDENKIFFENICNNKNFCNKWEQMSKIDVDSAKHFFDKRTNHNKSLFWKLALSAASVAVLFVVGWHFLYHNQESEQNSTLSSIQIGQQKAVLITSSGDEFVLSDNVHDTLAVNESKFVVDSGTIAVCYKEQQNQDCQDVNTLQIPRGGEYQMVLSDGTKVWLNSETTLKFASKFYGNVREVSLVGEAYFQVAKDETKPFIIKTTMGVIKVLGTQFSVRAYENTPFLTTLEKGLVQITDNTGWNASIKPGEQGVISFENHYIHEVNVARYTAWKDGYFMSDGEPLKDLMDNLARWYDCSYRFINSDLETLRITAKLRKYADIDNILDILSKTNKIKFEKNGNMIIIK